MKKKINITKNYIFKYTYVSVFLINTIHVNIKNALTNGVKVGGSTSYEYNCSWIIDYVVK